MHAVSSEYIMKMASSSLDGRQIPYPEATPMAFPDRDGTGDIDDELAACFDGPTESLDLRGKIFS